MSGFIHSPIDDTRILNHRSPRPTLPTHSYRSDILNGRDIIHCDWRASLEIHSKTIHRVSRTRPKRSKRRR